ncbi:MAG: hypothetical protein MHPSP_002423, partial [Paramarteilia canceri]
VLSGDTFIIFSEDTDKLELPLKLFNIYAPKLARHPAKGSNQTTKSGEDVNFYYMKLKNIRHMLGNLENI